MSASTETSDETIDPLAEDAWRASLVRYSQRRSFGRWKAWRFHRWLAKQIEQAALEPDARLIVNCAPRVGKSALCSRYTPAWVLELRPDWNILTVSADARLATDHGRAVRDLLEQEDSWANIREDKKAAGHWLTDQGGGMFCVGMTSAYIGRGARVIIVDDPYPSWIEAQSIAVQEEVIGRFEGDIYTRREPGCAIIVIHQRVAKRDLTGYLVTEHQDTWKQISVPALAGPDDPMGRELDESIVPERFSSDEYKRMRDGANGKPGMPRRIWKSQYEQAPEDASGDVFHEENVGFWWDGGVEPPPQFVRNEDGETVQCAQRRIEWDKIERRLGSVDCTFKGKDRDKKRRRGKVDHVAIHAWATNGPDRFLVDREHGQWGFSDSIKAMERLHTRMSERKQPLDSWLIEEAANGDAIIEKVGEKLPGVEGVRAIVDKRLRGEAVEPQFRSGNVWLPHPHQCPWTKAVLGQIVSFTGEEGAEDDDVDAMTQALRKLADSSTFAWA